MIDRTPSALFPTDEPLEPGHLIGRGADVSEIANRLRLGSNVILSAPRRTGKTTVGDAVLAELSEDPAIYAVTVDLFAVDGADQLADALIESTMSARPALRKAIRAAKQAGRTVYESVGVTLGARMLGTGELDGLEINLLPTLRSDPHRHLEYALALPQRIAAVDGKRLVLFIDEFQAVQRIGVNQGRGAATALKQQMRTAFQRSPSVSFLFAGSLEHMMRDLFGNKSEPFFSFGGFHELRAITADEWREGITARLALVNMGVDRTALDSLIEKGEGHPRSTMLLSQQAYEAAILAGSTRVDSNTAALAYEAALQLEKPRHEQILLGIQQIGTPAVNRLALRAATTIAAGGKPYTLSKHAAEVTRALNALRDAGVIDLQPRRIADPLFAEYLRRNRR
jgi:hypothetical protein